MCNIEWRCVVWYVRSPLKMLCYCYTVICTLGERAVSRGTFSSLIQSILLLGFYQKGYYVPRLRSNFSGLFEKVDGGAAKQVYFIPHSKIKYLSIFFFSLQVKFPCWFLFEKSSFSTIVLYCRWFDIVQICIEIHIAKKSYTILHCKNYCISLIYSIFQFKCNHLYLIYQCFEVLTSTFIYTTSQCQSHNY